MAAGVDGSRDACGGPIDPLAAVAAGGDAAGPGVVSNGVARGARGRWTRGNVEGPFALSLGSS